MRMSRPPPRPVRAASSATAGRSVHAKKLVADAVEKGSKLLTGGRGPACFLRGYFYEPTVLGDVPDEARVMQDEPFSPIAPIARFKTLEEVIERANATPFGLTGYVFSRNLRTATLAAA